MSTTENPDKKILRVVQWVIKMPKQNEELFRPLRTENLSGARIFIPPHVTAPNCAFNLHFNKPWCLIYFQKEKRSRCSLFDSRLQHDCLLSTVQSGP